ncbi:hypothetical protein MKX01_012495 [Papaver californicum]|nr:hypothetical protein MKX01_012495 [Papaver californicum]
MLRSSCLILKVLLLAFFSTTKSYSSSPTQSIYNSSLSSPQNGPNPNPSFISYVLAIQFTKSLCTNPKYGKTCDPNWNSKLPKKITIHGLWPTDFVGKTPLAPGKPFDRAMILQHPKGHVLLQSLYKDWVKAYFVFDPKGYPKEVQRMPSAAGFWKHEWKKHGDLSGLSVPDYFYTAQNLFSVLGDIYGIFKAQKMIVGGNVDIPTVSRVLAARFQVKPFLKCIFDNSRNELLYKIEFKYRADLTTIAHHELRDSNCTNPKVGLQG